jgi:glycosyltransferase involved in cell wall biosynthesis
MRIAAILGVKDEAELLPHCIGQLRAIGVDRIEAIDAGSSDGSLEWLQARHAAGELGLHRFSDQDPDAQGWNDFNVALARDSGADWVLFLDADEVWLPAGGDLRACLARAPADVLIVPRYNVPLGEHGLLTADGAAPRSAHGTALIAEPVPDFRARLTGGDPMPWIRGVPVPKPVARRHAIGRMHDGGHDVDPPPGVAATRARADDIVIAHLPFTTLARFARKVANIRGVFEVHDAYLGEHLAWHWRRWLALDTPGAVAAEFERQRFDAPTLSALRAAGVVRDAGELLSPATAPATATVATPGGNA